MPVHRGSFSLTNRLFNKSALGLMLDQVVGSDDEEGKWVFAMRCPSCCAD